MGCGWRTRTELARVSAPRYLDEFIGTIGADPFLLQGTSG